MSVYLLKFTLVIRNIDQLLIGIYPENEARYIKKKKKIDFPILSCMIDQVSLLPRREHVRPKNNIGR